MTRVLAIIAGGLITASLFLLESLVKIGTRATRRRRALDADVDLYEKFKAAGLERAEVVLRAKIEADARTYWLDKDAATSKAKKNDPSVGKVAPGARREWLSVIVSLGAVVAALGAAVFEILGPGSTSGRIESSGLQLALAVAASFVVALAGIATSVVLNRTATDAEALEKVTDELAEVDEVIRQRRVAGGGRVRSGIGTIHIPDRAPADPPAPTPAPARTPEDDATP